MSDEIRIAIPIKSLSESLEIYHQARLAGALDRSLFTETLSGIGPAVTRYGMLLNVFFEASNAKNAMVFKLTYGGGNGLV